MGLGRNGKPKCSYSDTVLLKLNTIFKSTISDAVFSDIEIKSGVTIFCVWVSYKPIIAFVGLQVDYN